ncbi:hypothetical protein F5X96DRAFT_645068 [Biscogniauxia mediterranea]|nr:hypothetical protein F5X96DRAFT_645068 [Biscogniauxia mediterranea]
MSQQSSSHVSGPPYASRTANMGGVPDIIPDIPICAVLIVIYACFAATNMAIFQINQRRGHKFIMSAMLFGFSMARITTLSLRIAWATHQHNVRLAMAANILVNAGILVVYVVNLIFAQRILRAVQPSIGWHPSISIILKVFYFGIFSALVCVITAIVLTSYTLDAYTLMACRDILLAASTYLLVFTTLPIWLLAVAHVLLPRANDAELFGHGTMRTKVIIVTLSSCLCILIAGFKTGVNWETPRAITNPAWYHTKPVFYCFNFVLEILILCLLTFTRVDKRFHIPNGSSKPGDYSQPNPNNNLSAEKGNQSDDTAFGV